MSPRPKRNTVREPSKYRYTGYTDTDGQWVGAMVQCEEQGNHRVTPITWPPPRTATEPTDPSLSLRCDLCGCHLVVYEAHATGGMQGIDVILAEKKSVTVR